MRSKLWAVESQIDRSELPSFAEILRDHAALGERDLDELSVNSTTERSQCCISLMAEMYSRRRSSREALPPSARSNGSYSW